MIITEVNPRFGAILTDVDLQTIKTKEASQIRDAIRYYKVLSIPSQNLNISSFENFVQQLGSLVSHRLIDSADPNHPFADIVHRDSTDKGILFGGSWHSDGSFEENPPDFTCVFGDIIPPVKNITRFGNSVTAYSELSNEQKEKLTSLQAIHTPKKLSNTCFQNISFSDHFANDMNLETIHPIVKVHPHTQESYLYVNYLYTPTILNYDQEESETLLLNLFKEQAKQIYEIEWSNKMVLLWDNRLVIHKAQKCPGYERKIIRYLVRDDKP